MVPGSGGKDSAFVSHILKYKYGMNPLTCTWQPIMYTDYGYKNFGKIDIISRYINIKSKKLNFNSLNSIKIHGKTFNYNYNKC